VVVHKSRNMFQPTCPTIPRTAAFHDSYKPRFKRLEVTTGKVMQVNVHVKLFGVFRSAARTNELNLQVPDQNPTVKAAISQLASAESFAALRHVLLDSETADPRPYALIMVSGREISTLDGLETKLTENDDLSLLPVTHGG
jgi:molybdopterin converting factor small subunit